ncbi:hypothetical protein [Streptomyces caniscabiei]|uniref:hypothetical protein n=1 Tax=Streptomyces caniscabiei TaxID=2746961 RepID=UPI000766116D|nr:hypothetical protein [Streptomyces caniscabiei]
MFEPVEAVTDEVVLAFKKYAQQFTVDEGVFCDVDVAVQRGIFGDFAVQFRAKILADDLPPETFTARKYVTYEVPTSTWQMWKKRHAQRWYARRLVARWPVRYEPDPDRRGAHAECTFNLERWRSYPQARVSGGQFGNPVRVHAIRDLRWTEETP